MIPTAVIVTRGDVDLAPILESLPPTWPVVVWNNLERDQDFKVYGHFAALDEVETDYVYVQDDDAICPAADILAAWDENKHRNLVLLNEADGETPWISWGAIFRRTLPAETLQPYIDLFGVDPDLMLWCDLVLTMLAPWENVDLGRESLPHAYADDRMWKQPGHYAEQLRVAAKVREALL